jgi:hypothetical protein
MIFNLAGLQARQTGSSTRTKVLLKIMLRDTTVCQDDLVKQALRTYRDRYEELTRVSWQHPVYRHRRRSKSKFLSLLPGTRPS